MQDMMGQKPLRRVDTILKLILLLLGGALNVGFANFFQADLGTGQAALILDGGLLFRRFADRG